ncbi:hypothetical protein XELAEV_18021322mg [Xenopus laevis]|uniref:Uncharacterized protein n=1 Tax=Xenopus laevis TaxID=8355 RepID=A0A974DA73_XENLA|nr:hypothetical protein XELAEV_18021322mg [Xenopus laevis]
MSHFTAKGSLVLESMLLIQECIYHLQITIYENRFRYEAKKGQKSHFFLTPQYIHLENVTAAPSTIFITMLYTWCCTAEMAPLVTLFTVVPSRADVDAKTNSCNHWKVQR